MLKEIVSNKYFTFEDKFDSWEEAIKKSYEPLLKNKVIDESYIKKVIECVKQYGPYIVISDDIAMPHSTEGAEGCYDTAISFMKVEKAVDFGEDVDGKKQARLFFSLAAKDHNAHMKNIQDLMEVLMNEEIVGDLLKCRNETDLKKVAEKYE